MTEEILTTILPLLRDRGRIYRYARGEVLIHRGDPMERFLLLQDGRAKLTVNSSDTRELLVFFTRENETIGDLEFFMPGNSTVTVRAVTPCTALGMEMEKFRQLCSDQPECLRILGKSLAYKLRRANNKNSMNILYSLRDRLSSYLHNMSVSTGSADQLGDSLTEIAELLGTSYRHLNRVVTELCREGLLKRSRWGLIITDRERIGELAGEISLY